jgi:TRAP-type mannitol/chloroaromatic compound transport system permease large subunit
MLRHGYDVRLAAGAITAGGCLGILIPPSIMLIVYGATAGVSVVKLYAGAFLPGLMLAGLYIGYVMLVGWWKPHLAPRLSEEDQRIPAPPPAVAGRPTDAGIERRLAPGLFGRDLRHGQRRAGQQCGQRNGTECHDECPHGVEPGHRCTDGRPTGRGGKRFFGVLLGVHEAQLTSACAWQLAKRP